MPTPLILDVDTGVDDMVALLLAVASPEVDLIAATCVTGNVHVDMVTRNTSLVLELAGAGGNVTPRAEANVWMDPEAAAQVFDAWSGLAQRPLCVGLDVTERVWLSRDDVDAICAPAPASELATLIGQAIPFYIDFYASTG